MKYQNIEELERISKCAVHTNPVQLGSLDVNCCRVLSSYWLCTFPTRDGIGEHLSEDGYWESWITQWMSNNVQPGSVCIDGGSTYGYFTFFLASHGCRVYSIEANPQLIPLLEYSNYLNGAFDRVTIINKAVLNKGGKTVRLGFSDTIGGTSVNLQSAEAGVLSETIALDEMLMFEPRIDFIKLDLAGAEEKALQGMGRIFKTNPACVCILEFSKHYHPNAGRNFFEQLLAQFQVSYIEFDGIEVKLSGYDFFESDTENWRMLVLRKKNVSVQRTHLIGLLSQMN